MIENMSLYYGTQIPKITVNDVIKKTEQIIKIRQICRDELPTLCNRELNTLLAENMQSITYQKQEKPQIPNESLFNQAPDKDNRASFVVKNKRQNHQNMVGRLSFDANRNSSALKSKREQNTASTTHRRKDGVFNRTLQGSFYQQRTWTQSECRRLNCRTASTSAREKYIKLKEQFLDESTDDEGKRLSLIDRRRKQQQQQQRNHQAFLVMSYQKRLLKQEFQNAKIVQQEPYSKKKQETIEIINYQLQNGAILTNKFRKPFRKTVENIINLQYHDKSRDQIFKRVTQKQSQIENPKRKKSELQRQYQRQKIANINHAYNNGGNRQFSFMPYVTISPGVSLSESTIKATISRSRPLEQKSRKKYLQSIQNKTFRSYSKDHSKDRSVLQNQMMTIDVCERNKSSRTSLNNETKDSFRKSLLWGARTSREGHRIKVQQEDLFKQLTD